MDNKKRIIRYFFAFLAIILMVALSEWLGEKEIIFPEMVALTIGLWIIDKRVWKVRLWQIVCLLTVGSVFGVCLVRYSPLPLVFNLCLAFCFAGVCLLVSRSTLIPQISACMLPVLLHTETWVYPLTVFFLSCLLVGGQKLMEKGGLRQPVVYVAAETNWKSALLRWTYLLVAVLLVAALSAYTSCTYLIIPPLVVTFAEFANSGAGFRNRPVQVFLFLVTAAALGTLFQWVGYSCFHLPESIIVFLILGCLFLLFEWTGKYFAPAGAMALIPLVVPAEGLAWLPLQAAAGAALFILVAMIVFQKCYTWSRAQLIFCFTPTLIRDYRNRKKKNLKRANPIP